jgi:cell division protein FtsI/penicillin-binding protein 2
MQKEVQEQLEGRLRILQIALAVILLLLAVRLVDLQVLRADGSDASLSAQANETQNSARGRIFERRGLLLATDIFRWEVGADPRRFDDDTERKQAALCLEAALGLSATEILGLLQQDVSYVVVRRDVPWDIARMINGIRDDRPATGEVPAALAPADDRDAEAALGGSTSCHWPLINRVWASPYPVRLYPQGEYFAHILGFVVPGGPSYYGLEEYYRAFLQGEIGPERKRHSTSALPDGFSLLAPSEVGYDLILTVDWRIQRVVERELAKAVEGTGAEGGTIIVIQPATGAILASASYPSYDPNEYAGYPEGTPLFSDPAISSSYEPGSVFKIITLAIALDSGAITPHSVFVDPGTLEVGGRVFQNADGRAHGQVTATEILARSLNVGIAHVGETTGIDTFYRYLPRFGFDRKTGVDLAHEGNGLVKYPGDGNWSHSDFIANTFGQAISVTPLQMASAVAAIANDGVLMRPHVVDKLVLAGQTIEVKPTAVKRVVSEETARTLTEMMVTAVELGAPEALIDECDVAGKTGTAQIAHEGGYHEEWTIASFAGYAPAHEPAFACLIKLDKPQSSIWGSQVAAPVFREIAPQILSVLEIPPES